MERFANVSIQICNLNPEVALHAMLMALKPGSFVDSLCRRTPEHTEFHEQILVRTQGKQDQNHNKDKLKVSHETQFKKNRPSKGSRYEFYTPLNTSRVHILEEASNAKLITLPLPGHNPNTVNMFKHYYYHRNYDHTTEECRTLKDLIEELVQSGNLKQYVQRTQPHIGGYQGPGRRHRRGRGSNFQADQPSSSRQNVSIKTEQAPLRGVINTIIGGFAGGGPSSSARKRQLRSIHNINISVISPLRNIPPITFTDDDYTGICPNQDDPMVIAVEVAN
ncbi:uncharacterized protein LOC109818656 [Cajanus cajan]|uniref:uncharacterized protein LOC109818656 n=1 Tax=Cajanus cajan TaxID=3821 RepID=UPI00098D8280|nr:uncharacterized protein LOC109818656 [Cajanus cajan]